jgi:peptidoglycan/xylan/chitin deacetylase (PgdA/CDA1 family)
MPPKQERDQMERDLLGYAGAWPDLTWPNGSRLAVSVVVNFEEGAERQVGDGDPESERIGEVISVVAPGTRDIAYGMRAGLWRMLAALEERRLPATFFACGQAVARVPALAAAVTRAGHEMAVHGWRWRPHADYADRASEAADLDRCIAAISAATGTRPVGFFCRGSESVWTRELLIERGFAYTSNGFDDDLPYWDETIGRRLLVVPYALDSNDMKFFHPNGFVRAKEMVDYAADALATLLAEARSGKPRLLNLGFHLRIVGRPARFPAFAGILEMLAARRDEIWIATRAGIAAAFAARMPQNRPEPR